MSGERKTIRRSEIESVVARQHRAIDSLMAALLTREGELGRLGKLKREEMFMPSKSGHIWEAVKRGNELQERLRLGLALEED